MIDGGESESLELSRNTDDAPVNITNKIGRVVLGKGGIQNQGQSGAP